MLLAFREILRSAQNDNVEFPDGHELIKSDYFLMLVISILQRLRLKGDVALMEMTLFYPLILTHIDIDIDDLGIRHIERVTD